MADFPSSIKTWADLMDWPDPSASRASSSDINSAYAEITAIESILLSDTDTLNSSSDIHGLMPKLSGSSDYFMNGKGEWAQLADALNAGGFIAVDLIGGVPHKQMYAGAGAMKPTLTNGCASAAQIEMGTNKNVYDYLAFDSSDTEYAYFNIVMPQDYTGGVIYANFEWTHPASSSDFGVAFGLQGVSFSNDDTLDAAQGTGVLSIDTGGTTSDLYISPTTTAITIAGTPAAGDLVNFRVYRLPSDGGDTLAVDAYLLGVMVWYPVA